MKSPANRKENGSREKEGSAREARIQARAHQLYLARGRKDGNALEDWLHAEREVNAQERKEAMV